MAYHLAETGQSATATPSCTPANRPEGDTRIRGASFQPICITPVLTGKILSWSECPLTSRSPAHHHPTLCFSPAPFPLLSPPDPSHRKDCARGAEDPLSSLSRRCA